MPFTYRSPGPWGGGTGSPLTEPQFDGNTYESEQRLNALEALPLGIGIDYISEAPPNQLFFHLTDHTILGPFTLPFWTPTNVGPFVPFSIEVAGDFVTFNGSIYLVLINFTAGATFSAGATDGMGHNVYKLWWTSPGDVLPNGGIVGDFLKVTAPGGGGPPTTAWGAPPVISTVQTQTNHTWEPGTSDANTYNRFTHAGGCMVTLLSDAVVPMPLNTEIYYRESGGGAVEILPASGVTINPVQGFLNQTAVPGATIMTKKVAANEWDIAGLLAPHT